MSQFNCDQFPNGKVPQDPRSKCPECGLPNKCGVEEGKGTCWCFSFPTVEHLTVKDTTECLCQSCLKKELDKQG